MQSRQLLAFMAIFALLCFLMGQSKQAVADFGALSLFALAMLLMTPFLYVIAVGMLKVVASFAALVDEDDQ